MASVYFFCLAQQQYHLFFCQAETQQYLLSFIKKIKPTLDSVTMLCYTDTMVTKQS